MNAREISAMPPVANSLFEICIATVPTDVVMNDERNGSPAIVFLSLEVLRDSLAMGREQ